LLIDLGSQGDDDTSFYDPCLAEMGVFIRTAMCRSLIRRLPIAISTPTSGLQPEILNRLNNEAFKSPRSSSPALVCQ
jgi:hypothetical protein